jgi:hypothetical protein
VIWKAEPLCEEQQVLFSNLCLPKSSNSSLLFSFAQIGLLQTLNVQVEVVECVMLLVWCLQISHLPCRWGDHLLLPMISIAYIFSRPDSWSIYYCPCIKILWSGIRSQNRVACWLQHQSAFPEASKHLLCSCISLIRKHLRFCGYWKICTALIVPKFRSGFIPALRLCCFARLLQIPSRYICTRSHWSPAFVSVCHGLIKWGRRFPSSWCRYSCACLDHWWVIFWKILLSQILILCK